MTSRRIIGALCAASLALPAAGCSIGEEDDGAGGAPTTVERTTRVEVVRAAPGQSRAFDPRALFERAGPGVVTVFSEFNAAGDAEADEGVGSGFVLSDRGEIITNAHVVTQGQGKKIERADDVYVQFADGNQVPAEIVGDDPNADIALLRVQRGGLTLRPLPLATAGALQVGTPVAAIGSPYGEPQSMSTGIISGVDRTIDSLTGFTISGAIQTDAAINRGNSGGPLIDRRGRVLGVNSQIRSTSGGGEGVGYAVPIDTVRRSVAALRRDGKVRYAFLGIETTPVYPQLATRFGLGTRRGAWVQGVRDGGPADDAGLRAGDDRERFQARPYLVGGDVIVRIGERQVGSPDELAQALQRFSPGDDVPITVVRDGRSRIITVKAGERPAETR